MALTLTDPNTEAGYLFLLFLGVSLCAYVLIRLVMDWRADQRFWKEQQARQRRRA